MPLFLWIGTLLGTLFTSLFSTFLQLATKRLAIIVAVVAAIGALTVAFFVAITSLVNSIAGVVPSYVIAGCALFVPSNVTACFAAIFTAHIIRWVYEWNVKVIQMRLN